MSAVTLALLFFLSVALKEQVTEGCSCGQRHPQQHFCSSDVVLRAKVIGKIPSDDPEIDEHEIKVIQGPSAYTAYEIETIEKFKPLDEKLIKVIYTDHSSCGISLSAGEYLLSGRGSDGRFFVGLCDFLGGLNNLSTVQERYLSMYQRGCGCEISRCTGLSCLIKKRQKKCLIRVNDSFRLDDEEALQSICLPDSAGFCSWQKILDK